MTNQSTSRKQYLLMFSITILAAICIALMIHGVPAKASDRQASCSSRTQLLQAVSDTAIGQDTTDTSQTPQLSGFVKENGQTYYYVNGKKVANTLKTINGSLYYFDKNGAAVKNSLKRCKGKYYYFSKSGKALKNTWKKIDGKKYYFKGNCAAAIGSCKIGKKYYIFTDKGQLYKPKKTSILTVKGTKYYVGKNGQPVTGWHMLSMDSFYKANVIFVHKSGKLAAGEYVQGIKFTKKGKPANMQQAIARVAALKFINKHTDSSDSDIEKLNKCARYIIGCFAYVDKDCKHWKDDDWVFYAASEGFYLQIGDCNYLAAEISMVANALGFKDVATIQLARQHSYCRMSYKGKTIYYDNMGPVYGGSQPRFPNDKPYRIYKYKNW